MHSIDVLLLVATACDPTLVGDHHESVAGIPQSTEAIGNAIEQLDLRGISEIAVVGDEGVVPV